jgi:hypothetical protein
MTKITKNSQYNTSKTGADVAFIMIASVVENRVVHDN